MLETLQKKLLESIKSRDRFRSNALRNFIAELKKNIKDSKDKMNNDDHIKILQSMAKKYRQSIDQFSNGNRYDLVESEKKELSILEEFLPKMLSNQDIKNEVMKIVSDFESPTMADFGKIMGIVMSNLKGNADGSVVQSELKKLLVK